MTAVVDASVVVAALVDDGPAGRWADELVGSTPMAAPHLMPVEAANILRRAALAGDVSDDIASLAHADLVALPVELFAYELLAERIWELRRAVTAYDGWYVALAESLGVPLATLDGRLARAPGPRCQFIGPEDSQRDSVGSRPKPPSPRTVDGGARSACGPPAATPLMGSGGA